jgi:hypothetical protein
MPCQVRRSAHLYGTKPNDEQGASTGPRTVERLERSRHARWNHGKYSAEALAEPKRVRELLRQSRELLKD